VTLLIIDTFILIIAPDAVRGCRSKENRAEMNHE